MTTDPTPMPNRRELRDVLDAYALDRPSTDSLHRWIEAHPEFEAQLRAFTEQWEGFEQLPESSRTSEERSAEARITARSRADRMARFEAEMPDLDRLAEQELADERAARGQTEQQVAMDQLAASLDDAIKAAGHTKKSLRTRLGLGRGSWTHFSNGMMEAVTEQSREAFSRIVDQVAAVLAIPASRVPSLLPATPTLPVGTNYGQSRPEAGSRIDVLDSLAIPDPTARASAVQYYLTGEGEPPNQPYPVP